MANSGQNFLDLLFGGINQGIGQFRRERDQRADLALTLQQMLERRQQAAQGQQNWEKQFGAEQDWRREQRNRQAGLDLMTAQQMANENYLQRFRAKQDAEKLAIANRAAEALAKFREAQAAKAERDDIAQRRLAIGTLLTAETKDPRNYEVIPEKAYKNLPDADKKTYEEFVDDLNKRKYRRLRVGAANKINTLKASLRGIGGLDEGAYTEFPVEQFSPNETQDTESFFEQYLGY